MGGTRAPHASYEREMRLRAAVPALAFCLLTPLGETADLTVGEILARVGENQERSELARARIVYQQQVLVRLLAGKGRVTREEMHLYTVTPTPDSTKKQLDRFEGRLLHKGEMLPYAEPHFERTAVDGDAIVSEVLLDFVNEDGKDGLDDSFFPLTPREQQRYVFTLLDEERVDGRDVYRIAFEPRKKGKDDDFDRAIWEGEAFVDKEQFQPVFVTTNMARKVPLAVRTLLGTNFKQIGFALHYREVEDGVWLPVSYGGEFRIKAVFFYNRTATIALENRDFRRTDVESTVEFEQ